VNFSRNNYPNIPSDQQLREASPAEWQLMRNWIGGNYAYNLGVIDGRCLKAPRFNGRTHFAWLGDAPMLLSALKQMETFSRVYDYSHNGLSLRTNSERNWNQFRNEASANTDQFCEDGLTWFSHEGRGFNIVFEDGHVAFVSLKGISPEALEPFLNHAGSLQAGVEPNDSALGPSHFGPWTIIPTGISRSVP
jgi:prepilin-type processing-associated H-X9-DG protein